MPNQPAIVPIIQQSALDFISSGLRLIGAIGSGDPISASEQNDAQMVLNQLLDSWSADRLTVYQTPRTPNDQNGIPFTLKAGQQSYFLGNVSGAEDFYTPRPPKLERISLMYSASPATPIEVPLQTLDDVEWQAIANKSTPSLLPQAYNDDEGFPDRTISFWPIPTVANPIVLYPWVALQLFADLETKLSFPPAYARALRFNLAVDLAAEFPGDPQKLPLVMKLAAQSKDKIIGMNSKVKVAWCDEAILGSPGRGNIFTGGPSRSRNF